MFNFFNQPKTPAGKLVAKFGIEDTAIFFANYINQLFVPDSQSLKMRQQFIREELDAASQGDAYSRAFANSICPVPSWYRGAMQEHVDYPIDAPGGPQQTLNAICLHYSSEDEVQSRNLRCSIVDRIDKYTVVQERVQEYIVERIGGDPMTGLIPYHAIGKDKEIPQKEILQVQQQAMNEIIPNFDAENRRQLAVVAYVQQNHIFG